MPVSPPARGKIFALDTRAGWVGNAITTLVLGALLVVITPEVLHNDRGVVINGFIRLGPTGATILQFFGVVFLAVWLWFLVATMIQRRVNPHSIVLGPDAIAFGRGWFRRREERIAYAEIHGMD